MKKFLALLLAVAIMGTSVPKANYDSEGLGSELLFPSVLQDTFIKTEPLTFRERLNYQVSRGEIRKITVEATAYDLSYDSCGKYPSDPAYGVTASGEYAQEGFIAVDPEVIPLNTRVYIEGYGFAIAKDVGGDIKGNRIDIFMNSHSMAMDFGRKIKQVYILGK